MEEGRQDSPDPPNCTHQRHKITKHCFICFVRARGRPCVRADPCKVHRSEGSDFWKEVELHDLSLERRRKRKGATFSPSRKSMRVSSKPHRFQPLDFVTVNPSPAKGSKTTPKKRNKRSSGSDGEFPSFSVSWLQVFYQRCSQPPSSSLPSCREEEGGGGYRDSVGYCHVSRRLLVVPSAHVVVCLSFVRRYSRHVKHVQRAAPEVEGDGRFHASPSHQAARRLPCI